MRFPEAVRPAGRDPEGVGQLRDGAGRAAPGGGKARRQQAILDLVRERPLGRQEELAAALSRRGFTVTQSTLSRDLRELRVARVPTADGLRYLPAGEGEGAASGSSLLAGIAPFEVTAVEANETAVVVRTRTGHAQGVAVYLDGLRLPDVLATVAGDDTILVLPTSTRRTRALRRQLSGLLGAG
jgi:transcriptional regulator of arginine metabolism